MNEDSRQNIHLSIRIIYNLIIAFEEHSKDSEIAKQLYSLVVPVSLPILLEAFTKEEMGS